MKTKKRGRVFYKTHREARRGERKNDGGPDISADGRDGPSDSVLKSIEKPNNNGTNTEGNVRYNILSSQKKAGKVKGLLAHTLSGELRGLSGRGGWSIPIKVKHRQIGGGKSWKKIFGR